MRFRTPEESPGKEHARELDDRVIDHHIGFFVNSYSLSLGDEGRRAVRELTGVEV